MYCSNRCKQRAKNERNRAHRVWELLGQWHANLCGLGDIFDPEQRKTALQNLFRNNFKSSMREIPNTWRVFAINDEAGTVICDYPADKEMPDIPIAYAQECMTGME